MGYRLIASTAAFTLVSLLASESEAVHNEPSQLRDLSALTYYIEPPDSSWGRCGLDLEAVDKSVRYILSNGNIQLVNMSTGDLQKTYGGHKGYDLFSIYVNLTVTDPWHGACGASLRVQVFTQTNTVIMGRTYYGDFVIWNKTVAFAFPQQGFKQQAIATMEDILKDFVIDWHEGHNLD